MADESDIGRLFTQGSVVEQIAIWGVIYEAVRLSLQPFFNELTYTINKTFPNVEIAVPDLLTLVQRNVLLEEDAAKTAADQGVNANDFHIMLGLRRLPPGIQQVIQMAYRGIVPWGATDPNEVAVESAVRQSDISDEWFNVLQTYFDPNQPNGGEPIPIAALVDATVEGQIDYATGERLAKEVGFNADRFRILFNTRGNPPGPADLIELVRRGFIPLQGVGPDQTTLQQGIFEGATKDKWEPLYEQLVAYLPPPRTVTALQRAGAISATEALQLYKQQGLTDELAAAYVANASTDKLAGSKQLAEGIITKLYYDQAIDAPTATSMLEPLGYDATEAAFILEVQDLNRVTTAVNSAVSRIGTLYIAHKIDQPTARAALAALQVPGTAIDLYINTWVIEAGSNVKLLTQAEITDAYANQFIDQPTAMAELESLGYNPLDSWILLSNKMKAAQPNQPGPGPNPLYPLPGGGQGVQA